ncbi:hypothetical protein CSKR_100265 [Clonorchis sinensis]|uniref:Uncharacterized protein n=1 Tax=Clonorchis sinensis TaxID=79923 RepID=A0A3R7JH10_CLOSI|nr:hypothetical protein CSKR_100265 [Clonorchis sinensis]
MLEFILAWKKTNAPRTIPVIISHKRQQIRGWHGRSNAVKPQILKVNGGKGAEERRDLVLAYRRHPKVSTPVVTMQTIRFVILTLYFRLMYYHLELLDSRNNLKMNNRTSWKETNNMNATDMDWQSILAMSQRNEEGFTGTQFLREDRKRNIHHKPSTKSQIAYVTFSILVCPDAASHVPVTLKYQVALPERARLGQPGSTSAPVLSFGVMVARNRKDVTAGRLSTDDIHVVQELFACPSEESGLVQKPCNDTCVHPLSRDETRFV